MIEILHLINDHFWKLVSRWTFQIQVHTINYKLKDIFIALIFSHFGTVVSFLPIILSLTLDLVFKWT